MQAKKKRLTLDIDAPVQRRLKAAAALKGVSMRGYCLAAINKELALDEANGVFGQPPTPFSFSKLESVRDEVLGDRSFPGDSAEFIREARESRVV